MVNIGFFEAIFKKCPVNNYDVNICFDSDKVKEEEERKVICSLVKGFVNC